MSCVFCGNSVESDNVKMLLESKVNKSKICDMCARKCKNLLNSKIKKDAKIINFPTGNNIA